MHYSSEVLIGGLTILSGVLLGLYMAKRKQYNDLVSSHRHDEERRWTDKEIERIWTHISQMENACTSAKGKKISF